MIKKAFILVFLLILLVTASYFLGPRPKFDSFDNYPVDMDLTIDQVDKYILETESQIDNIKPDNHARVVWADSTAEKTPYSIVYLHGFSASQGEGHPIHINLASRIGANLFLPRLEEHGIADPDAFQQIEPAEWVEDAKEAIGIGKILGDSVIVMGCSTGGTLAIYLAANDPSIHSLVLLSPNIDIYSQTTDLLTGPWGKKLAYSLIGPRRQVAPGDTIPRYWSGIYHTDGLIALQGLLDQTMQPSTFSKLAMPLFCGYYYKDEDEQDFVVSVEAMLDMQSHLKTPNTAQRFVAFPDAGDHVIGSIYKNPNYTSVEEAIFDFLVRHTTTRPQ